MGKVFTSLQLSQSKKSVFTSIKSFPNNERFWQYSWRRQAWQRRIHETNVAHLLSCPIHFPNDMGTTLIHLLSWRVFQLTVLLYQSVGKLSGWIDKDVCPHTLCSSQGTPSTIYLKQKWQTHNVESPVCCLAKPPVSKSDVLPYVLGVFGTPVGFWEVWFADEEVGGSSASLSVRG